MQTSSYPSYPLTPPAPLRSLINPEEEFDFSPKAVVTVLPIFRGSVFVVRDDFLDGGTKQRAAVPYLQALIDDGVHEVVYASPFAGFAQVALAVSARAVGLNLIIFAARNPATGSAHEFTSLAESYGAKIYLSDDLSLAEERATGFIATKLGTRKIPLGLADSVYTRHLEEELRRQWKNVLNQVQGVPRRLWISLGSGTLLGVMRKVVDVEIEIAAFNIHVLSAGDARLESAKQLPNVKIYSAPGPFVDPVRVPPPIPSNAYYDAKLWETILHEGSDQDIWWNVAR